MYRKTKALLIDEAQHFFDVGTSVKMQKQFNSIKSLSNMANTKMVVSFAKQTGASVEAEIGTLGKRELGYQATESAEDDPKQVYTDPYDAERFVKETGIDALLEMLSQRHGIRTGKILK